MNVKDAKIVFFGFGDVGYKCLKYLLEEEYNVVAVFTHELDSHENAWFKSPEKIAKEYWVDTYKPTMLNTQKWFRKIKYLKPDLILSVYYRSRIPEEIFKQARLGAYNLHGSYLPAYRGRAPLNWAILNGENYTGATLHTLEKDFDTGDIVARKKVEFTNEEYVADVQKRQAKTAVELFVEALPLLFSTNVVKIKQSELGDASYFCKRTPADSRIDFSKTANEIRNLVRAVSRPFNGAFFEIENKRYVVWKADIVETSEKLEAGKIIKQTDSELIFSASDAFLRSTDFEIQ